MKPVIIRICMNNEAAKHKEKIEKIVTQYGQVEIVIEQCLNRCSFCEDLPYLLLQNGVEFGDDIDELCTAIEEAVQNLR